MLYEVMQRQIIYLLGFVTYAVATFMIQSISTHAQLSVIDDSSPSLTHDITHVVDTENITNPLRNGSRFGIESPDGESHIGVIDIGEILTFGQAKNQTLRLIHNIINYILSFVALVVFVYLIYE